MKQGWENIGFESCIDKVPATTKIQKKKFLQRGLYPIISQEDAQINGYWDNAEDVLIVTRPIVIFGDHTKKVKYVDFDFVRGADGVKVLLPKEFLDPRFFYYHILSLPIDDLGYARHYRLLKKNDISYPPLPEQKRIVAKLDQAFEAIDKAKANVERNLQNAKELFQSELNQIFTEEGRNWRLRKLGAVCIKIQDGAHHSPKVQYPTKASNQFLYITSKNIRNNYLDLTKVSYVEKSFHDTIYPRCKPELGDILLTKDGANTGNICLNTLDEPFSLLSSVCLIKTDRDVLLPSFLKAYIQSPDGFKTITGKMTGMAIKRIILKTIKNAEIPLPTILIQERIVGKLDKIYGYLQSVELKYQQEIDALSELKKSILQKAFNGELSD
jgi:type I restriction enzyme, S subunit